MGIWEDFKRNRAVANGTTYVPGQPTVSQGRNNRSGGHGRNRSKYTADGLGLGGMIDAISKRGTMSHNTAVANGVAHLGGAPVVASVDPLGDIMQGKNLDNGWKNMTRGALNNNPVVAEADDFVDGSAYDKWADDFTDDDIVNAVAPLNPGTKTKTPKKQLRKRAAVKKAIAPARRAPVANPYSMNPFAKNFSPSAFVDGAGSRQADVKHIAGAAAYEKQRKAKLNRIAKARMSNKSNDTLSLF